MVMKSVGFMLRTDGKATVKNDFAEVKQAGVDAFNEVAVAAESSAAKADAASQQFTQRQIEGFKKQAAAAKLAAAQVINQTAFNGTASQPSGFVSSASVNFDRSTGAAKDSAAVFQEEARRQEEVAAALLKIRAAIDPVTVAQSRYDGELKQYRTLLDAGHLSETEHAASVKISTARLNEAKRALDEHSGAMGLNRTQTMIAQSAGMRFIDMLLAGQSPIRAFALESHKLGEVLAFDDGGVAGGLAKVRALLTPTTIGIGVVAAAAALGASAWYSYSSAIAKLDAVSDGLGAKLGLSGAQLEMTAEKAATAGNISVSTARDLETAYLGVAKSSDVLTGLTSVTKDYAAATGQDLKAAQADLSKMFQDPIDGASELAEKYGLLTQAQSDHIAQLVSEGRQEQAQKEMLDDIRRAFGGAAEQAEGLASGWSHIANQADRAWISAGKFFDKYGKSMANGALSAFMLPDVDALIGTTPMVKPGGVQNAAANAARANANKLLQVYQGDNTDTFRRAVGAYQSAISAGGTPEQIRAWTEALEANKHAQETWVPASEKANLVAAAQAKLAAARGPAAKREAETELAMAQAKGQVITAADAEARAHSRADAAAAHATRTNAGHAESLARQAESMEVAAKASLDLAGAYLKGDGAAIEAEARRKAMTDATRKGIDVEAQVLRQINLSVAEGVATGAKSVAQLRDETAARDDVNAKIAAGSINIADSARALGDEAALRPLLRLQTVAQGDALTKLTEVIMAYRKALADAHAEEARSNAAKAIDDADTKIKEAKAAIADLSKSPLDQAIAAARRAANKQADDGNFSPADRRALVDTKSEEAVAASAQSRAKYVIDLIHGQQDSIALSQKELELAGANDNTRTLELDKLKASLAIKRQFPEMSQAETDAILAEIAAQDGINAKLKVTAAAIDEVRQFGGQFVDDVLNPDTWSSWGNAGKTILNDLKSEFLKLALLNPIKNLINGNSALPTLSSAISNIGKLFGHNASGTQSWSGGQTWVNENGPEIADLPNGTRIYPAAEARRMMAGNDNGGGQINHFHLEGAVVTQDLLNQMNAIGSAAAVRGAAGGAALGEANATATGTRRLGRRW